MNPKGEKPLLVRLPSIKRRPGRRLEIVAFITAVGILALSIGILISSIPTSFSSSVDAVRTSTVKMVVPPTLYVVTETAQTVPGTILQEGQTWQGNGLALTVEEFCILKCGEHIQVKFMLRNTTDHEILVDILGKDFQIVLEDKYYLSTNSEIRNEFIGPGNVIEWQWLFTYYGSDVSKVEPLPPDTSIFVLKIEKIGERLQEAVWKGSIPR